MLCIYFSGARAFLFLLLLVRWWHAAPPPCALIIEAPPASARRGPHFLCLLAIFSAVKILSSVFGMDAGCRSSSLPPSVRISRSPPPPSRARIFFRRPICSTLAAI